MTEVGEQLDAAAERLVGLGMRSLEQLSVIFFDTDLRIVAVQGSASRRHGYDPDRLVGRRAADVVPAAAWETVGPLCARALAGEAAQVRLPSLDGTALYETSFRPIHDDGVVVGGMAASREVTEQAAVQEALRRSEHDFRLLAETATDMIARTTAEGDVLYVSPACKAVLGLTPEQYRTGASLLAVVHPGDRERLLAAWRELLREGATTSTEFRVHRPDGSRGWVESDLRIVREPGTGRVLEVHSSSRDITRRKAGEEVARLWQATFETAPRGIAVGDPRRGTILEVNAAFAAMHGGAPEDFVGRRLTDLMADPEAGRAQHDAEELRSEGTARFTSEHVRLDGARFPVDVEVLTATAPDGGPRRIGIFTDLTELRDREASERLAVARFEQSFVEAPVGMLLLVDGRIHRANRAIGALVGLDPAVLVGRDPRDLLHPEDRAGTFVSRPGEASEPQERRVVTPDGRVLRLRLRSSVLPAEEGRLVLVHALDVTERHAATEELRAAHELFETTFERAPTGKVIAAFGGRGQATVLKTNPAFAHMLGYEPEEVVGRNGSDFVHPDDAPVRERMLAELRAGRPSAGEIRLVHGDGHAVWTYSQPVAVKGPAGEPLLLLQVLDISERKRFEGQLQFVADHDMLTGLFSRRRFESELEQELALVRRRGGEACLLLLDLDGFKDVNDSFGHSTGDDLLTRVAGAIKRTLREGDVVARLGGDEFAVVLPGTDRATGEAVAASLVDAVRGAGRVIKDGGHAEVTASVGLTTLVDAGSRDAEALLVEADIAMYQAKDAGKDAVAVYERGAGRRAEITQRADLTGRLRRALDEDRFVLHAQPVVPLGPAIAGQESYELLLRLRLDDGRLLRPGSFLQHAERHGIVVDIDRWVLRRAVAELHRAGQQGRDLSLAVNFSARTAQDPRIPEELSALLAATPIPEGSLLIEVTETAAITDVARAVDLARQLRSLGCKLALDDFGAGFASFYYLKHLVFDYLKVDGEFVAGLPTSATDQLVVRAVVDIARGLGAQVIAERVGDDATVALLTELGVRYGQGYFLGRPAPLPPFAG